MLVPFASHGPDWATISSLATAGGTLVLAIATFAAVRSSNRSARIAEVALQEQRRPVLGPSRLEDPVQKIMFVEGKWFRAAGGRGIAECGDGNVYLVLSLRNVGSGIAVCQGWAVRAGLQTNPSHLPEDAFRPQLRDLFVPAGDVGLWQGALRDRREAVSAEVTAAIETHQPISIELLYSDQVGEQRTISRFGLTPFTNDDGDRAWLVTASRHWFLDRAGPRSEEQVRAAREAFARLQDERAAAQEAEQAAAQEAEAAEQPAPSPTP